MTPNVPRIVRPGFMETGSGAVRWGRVHATPLGDISIVKALRNLSASSSPVFQTYLISDQLSPPRTRILGQVLKWRVAEDAPTA